MEPKMQQQWRGWCLDLMTLLGTWSGASLHGTSTLGRSLSSAASTLHYTGVQLTDACFGQLSPLAPLPLFFVLPSLLTVHQKMAVQPFFALSTRE